MRRAASCATKSPVSYRIGVSTTPSPPEPPGSRCKAPAFWAGVYAVRYRAAPRRTGGEAPLLQRCRRGRPDAGLWPWVSRGRAPQKPPRPGRSRRPCRPSRLRGASHPGPFPQRRPCPNGPLEPAPHRGMAPADRRSSAKAGTDRLRAGGAAHRRASRHSLPALAREMMDGDAAGDDETARGERQHRCLDGGADGQGRRRGCGGPGRGCSGGRACPAGAAAGHSRPRRRLPCRPRPRPELRSPPRRPRPPIPRRRLPRR